MKTLLNLLSFFGVAFLCASCYHEDCPPDFFMGDLYLTEATKEFIPPIENKTIVYTDSLGNELKLEVQANETFRDTIAVSMPCFVMLFLNNRKTIASMNAESIVMTLSDSQEQVKLAYTFTTEPMSLDPEVDTMLQDVLSIEKILSGEKRERSFGVTEKRGNTFPLPFRDSLLMVADTIIMNKPFQNLYYNKYDTEYFYSKSLGLVSFLGLGGTVWVWNRIE